MKVDVKVDVLYKENEKIKLLCNYTITRPNEEKPYISGGIRPGYIWDVAEELVNGVILHSDQKPVYNFKVNDITNNFKIDVEEYLKRYVEK